MEMLTRETIERAAFELGATKFGVGDLALFEGEDPRRDPKMICPKAQCIVGFGIPVPKAQNVVVCLSGWCKTNTCN